MPTFIDESGDVGTKPTSRPYFRLAAIWMPTVESAQGFREDVTSIRRRFNLSVNYEFKFSETSRFTEIREHFLNAAMKYGFRFCVCSVDKTGESSLLRSRDFIHYITATYIATSLRPCYVQKELESGKRLVEPVLVDDNRDSKYLDTIIAAFRGMMSTIDPIVSIVGPPKFKNSRHDVLLQLADMTCGAIGDHVSSHSNQDGHYYRIIKSAGVGVCCGWGPGITCLK